MKFKRSRNTSKQIIAVFSAKSGHAISASLQERKTVNAEWCMNSRLPKVFEAWSARRQNNGNHGLLLHHDNAIAYTVAATLDHLEANRVQLVTQTPYSPGSALVVSSCSVK